MRTIRNIINYIADWLYAVYISFHTPKETTQEKENDNG